MFCCVFLYHILTVLTQVETLFANDNVAEAEVCSSYHNLLYISIVLFQSAIDFEDGKQPKVMSGVRVAAAQEEDILWDYYPTEYLEV